MKNSQFSKKIKGLVLLITSLFFVLFVSNTSVFISRVSDLFKKEPDVVFAAGNAQRCISSSETSFGGKRTMVINCSCDNDKTLVYLDEYTTSQSISLLYEIGQSRLFEKNNVYGQYFLGCYANSSNVCRVGYGQYCISLKPDGRFGNQPGTGVSGM